MIKNTKIIKYIHESIDIFLDHVDENPYLLIYEADLRSILYMTLFKYRKIFRQPIYDREQTQTKTNILHTEYKYKKGGFYDIVVLDPTKFHKDYYLRNKPILAGFELKLCDNYNLKRAYELMENDCYAFDNQKNDKSAEYGFVILVNIVQEEHEDSDVNILVKKLKSLKSKRNLKKMYFYYIEIPDKKSDLCIVKI